MEPELTPLSLGDLLRRARQARGLDLARVEQDTRIRRAQLEALESDNLSALPAPVFTRGLVRAYSLYLGVSPIEALELLNKEEARTEHVGVRAPSHPPRYASSAPGRIAWALMALLLGTAFGAVLYVGPPQIRGFFAATTVGAAPTTVPTRPPEPAPSATIVPTPAPTTVPSPTQPPSPTPPPTATMNDAARATATAVVGVRGVTIEARTSGRVWSQVEADGQIVFSGILMSGEKKTWKAERNIVMHVGDAGLVDVTFNGRSLGTLGDPGEVVRTEWTATR